MPVQLRPIKHTMLESDEQVQREVEERMGTCPCIWQIKVVRKVLEGGDVITIAATGSVASKVEPSLWLNQVLDLILVSCSCHRGYSCF